MAEQMQGNGLTQLRGSRPWTEDEGRRVIEAWKESGLTVGAFARRAGLGVDRIYRWRGRLDAVPAARRGTKARPEVAPEPVFLPIAVRAAPTVPRAERSAAVTVCTRQGLRVEVAALDASSVAWVATLVRSLGTEQEVGA